MKRVLSVFLVILLLCLVPGMPSLAAEKMTEAEIGALAMSLYEKHQAYHALFTVESNEGGEFIEFIFESGVPDTFLGCSEYVLHAKEALPKTSRQVQQVFGAYFASAYGITENVDGANILQIGRFNAEFQQEAALGVMKSEWYKVGKHGDTDVFIGPILLVDKDREIIDGQIYLLAVFAGPEKFQIWVCADDEIVYDMLVGYDLISNRGSDAYAKYLIQWVADKQEYELMLKRELFILDETANPDYEVNELTPGERRRMLRGGIPDPIGMVVVTNSTRANLRQEGSADSKQVGSVMPGETYECIGIAESGWYQILFDERKAGYISPKMVSFTPLTEEDLDAMYR